MEDDLKPNDPLATLGSVIGAVGPEAPQLIILGEQAAKLGRDGNIEYEGALKGGEVRLDKTAGDFSDTQDAINEELAKMGAAQVEAAKIEAVPDLKNAPHAATAAGTAKKPGGSAA